METVLTVGEAKAQPLEELLQETTEIQETVHVALKSDEEIEIKLLPKLKPLLTFEGYVPDGWKDAIYAPKR